ncbi:MAG TPA: amidase family protein [Actinomycetota bacterium]|nr:amidase family protein [Actinomycetota bacterium]
MTDAPREAALREIAERWRLALTDAQISEVSAMIGGFLGTLEGLDPPGGGTRRRIDSEAPSPEDNPHNAWCRRFVLRGESDGILAGKRIALKDVVPVAGVPLTGGSAALAGFVPDHDATVVERVLAHGGEITGYATTEDMCITGASISSTYGYVRNPRDPARSAGGSSSGCAAVVAEASCEMSIGADQGGSIRVPASLCGVFGLKPTYGLVPYTRCIPIDPACDHLGPMAATAGDLALLLDATAGFDEGRDPRQSAALRSGGYFERLEEGIDGLRVGVVAEGVSADTEPLVAREFAAAADRLSSIGAKVVETSIPLHLDAIQVHLPIILQGFAHVLFELNAIGMQGKGVYDEGLSAAVAEGLETRSALIHPAARASALIGRYLWQSSGGAYYAKAQNKALRMREAYDAALDELDVLVLPTTQVAAPPLPPEDMDPFDAYVQTGDMRLVANTCSFNQTGHPAVTVPVGPSDGLPVGFSVVARHGDDATVLRVAAAMEAAGHVYRGPADAARA